MNGRTSPQQSRHVTPKTNGDARSTSLQRLLEKDAAQKSERQRSPSGNTTTAFTPKSNFGGGLKDKPSESAKEKKLTANKFEVVLNQQEPERRIQSSSSPVILLDEKSPPVPGRDSISTESKIKPAVSPKTPVTAKSELESKRTEDKQKVKKSLSPSLTALIERDAKNTQNFQQAESKKVEVNGTSSPKANEDSASKSEEPSKNWETFELKLQNKVKKGAEKPGRASLDARGSPDTRGSNLDNVKTRQTLIEDSSGKEREKIVRTFSAENRDSKGGKAVSSDVIDTSGMPSKAVSRKPSRDGEGKAGKTTNEDTQVKLSVNGDQITIPSVRARKNSFLSAEENSDSDDGKYTSGRERGSSLNISEESKTVIIEDTIKQSNATKTDNKVSGNRERIPSFRLSDEQNTIIIENSIEPHNLHAKEKLISRSVSQCSTNSREEGRKRVSSLSREASLDNTRASSIGESNQEGRQIRKQNSIENGAEIDKGTNSKEEGTVTVNSRAMPKILADLLARDGSEAQSRNIPEQASADNKNFYKDKLKELKKTTPIYTSAPIKLNDRGKSSANQGKASTASPANREKACTVSSNLQNGPDTVKTEMTVSKRTDSNDVQAKELSPGLAFNTKVFNSNSGESSSSKTSKLAAADGKQERLYSGKVMHIPSGSATGRVEWCGVYRVYSKK